MEPNPTQNSCKSQLYNLPLWLFCDKTPKTDSRLKREFGNSGKTHSHLITIKFGSELMPPQNSCKSQLYNLPLWLFCDKTPKIDSRLKREWEQW